MYLVLATATRRTRKTAELKWVEIVILERGRMLSEMEMNELENGEDIDAWFAEVEEEGSPAGDASYDEIDNLAIPGAYR